MMKRMIVVLALWLTVAPASAQPIAGGPAQPQTQQQQRREKIKQRIRALRAYTLTEQLDLDEATAARLFPALAKYDDEFDRLLVARAALQKRLDNAGSLTDTKAVDKLIDEAVANQRAIWDAEGKRLEQLRKILTPAQVARTLVVLPAMERKIHNQLRKAISKKPAPGAGGDSDRPADNFDTRPPPTTVDPFSDPGPPRKKPAPAPGNKKPCDPFGTPRECN